jgi:adenylylsulfate kinase-like enzyme
MERKSFGERMKLYMGITGIPAASAGDVMREARTPAFRGYRSQDRVDRATRRAKWWWARLLVGAGVLSIASLVGLPIVLTVTMAILGALLVLSGLMEVYIHYRLSAKNQDSSH